MGIFHETSKQFFNQAALRAVLGIHHNYGKPDTVDACEILHQLIGGLSHDL